MIAFTDVRFTYDGARYALDGATFAVPRGSYTCVVGGNGSGKSTLARHLNALLLPDAGTVVIDGQETAPATVEAVRRKVALVFQNPEDQLVAPRVEDDVAFGPCNLGLPEAVVRERVQRTLADVGLAGFERRPIDELSGGQKQRVAIAGALAMEPAVLVLDEASSMLDPAGRADLAALCRQLAAAGTTVVSVTHFMDEAARADQVIVMEAGRVVRQGAPAQVFARDFDAHAFSIEEPATARLCRALQALGLPVAWTLDEADLAAQVSHALASGATAGGQREYEANGPAAGAPKSVANVHDAGARNERPARTGGRIAAQPARTQPAATAAHDESAAGGAPADPAPAPLLSFRDVAYSYDQPLKKRRRTGAQPAAAPARRWAVDGVTFAVYPGEIVGLAGRTGSGKSTLARLAVGLAQPERGKVAACGTPLAGRPTADIVRSGVAVAFQRPERQICCQTVFDDVVMGPRNLGVPEGELEGRYARAMERMGLDAGALRAADPFKLSGGQQRRVALAGALAMDPQVLVLDEPAAGLDPAAREAMLSTIDGLRAAGTGILLVSHAMDDCARLCDRLVVLDAGRVVAAGTPAEVFADSAALAAHGLDAPAPQRLARALAKAGAPVPCPASLRTVDDLARAIAGA